MDKNMHRGFYIQHNVLAEPEHFEFRIGIEGVEVVVLCLEKMNYFRSFPIYHKWAESHVRQVKGVDFYRHVI